MTEVNGNLSPEQKAQLTGLLDMAQDVAHDANQKLAHKAMQVGARQFATMEMLEDLVFRTNQFFREFSQKGDQLSLERCEARAVVLRRIMRDLDSQLKDIFSDPV